MDIISFKADEYKSEHDDDFPDSNLRQILTELKAVQDFGLKGDDKREWRAKRILEVEAKLALRILAR